METLTTQSVTFKIRTGVFNLRSVSAGIYI